MPRPKKQSYKQSNAAIAHTFHHQSSWTSSPSSITQASTLAATTPPNSAPPSTIDPSDIPALESLDQSEGSVREYSPGPQENPITIDYPEDDSSDEGYKSDDYMSEMDGQELRDSLELQMEREIEQMHTEEERCQGSSDTGKEVQFSKVYFTPSYSRESCGSIGLDNTKKDNLFAISSN